MEHEYYFNFDIVPSDIWRLIFKQFRTMTDLRSFNSINKSCHNYSKYYMQKQKLWLGIYRSRFGLADTKFFSPILPSKLFHLKKMLQPSLNISKNNINFNQPLKIVVIGDGGIGKTSYTKLVSGGHVDKRYIATVGAEVHKFTVTSKLRQFQIVLWDTAGPEKFGGLRDAYYIGAVGAIVLSDVTSKITISNIPHWLRDIRRVCENIPVAVCVNKIDTHIEDPKPSLITRFRSAITIACKKNLMFCEMSNWAKFSVHEPLIWILQQLTGDDTLELTFPEMVSERHGVVDADMMNAALKARSKLLEYCIEDEDDFTGDLILPTQQANDASKAFYAKKTQKKRKVLEAVIQSCSPRVKNVMEALLTGVRTGPVLSTKNHHPLQQPSLLFVEGLECQEFHAIEKFNFVQPLLEFYKQHEDAIIMETKGLMGLSGLDDMTSSVNGSWKSFYFVESGQINHTSAETAPLLTHMLRGVSSLMTCSFGYAYISILGPHSHITPHCGPCNIKLRCHLPLIVPSEGCTIRVGSTTKSFKQGELLIFDDSIEHEVRNDSSSPRVILLFDIWHPDLTLDEINSFNTYFS